MISVKTFMCRTFNNMVPTGSYLSRKFTPISMILEHNLRGCNHKRFVPRRLTESLTKSFILLTEGLLYGTTYSSNSLELNLSVSLNLKFLNTCILY